MSREAAIRFRARAVVDLSGELPGALLFAAARRVRNALRPGPAWLSGPRAFTELAAALVEGETGLFAALTAEEATWGYGPAEAPGLVEAPAPGAASRPRRAPGSGTATAGALSTGETRVWRAVGRPSVLDPAAPPESVPKTGPDRDVKSHRLARPGTAGASEVPAPELLSPGGTSSPTAPVDPAARRLAAAWWAARCAGMDTVEGVRLDATGQGLESEVLGTPGQRGGVSREPSSQPAPATRGSGAGTWPGNSSEIGGPAAGPPVTRSPASDGAARGPWPPPLGRPEIPPRTSSGSAASRQAFPRDRGFAESVTAPEADARTRLVDLRTARGGSIGRIPVDVDPAGPPGSGMEPDAPGRDEPAWEDDERVRWLPDDDDLAEKLHRVLRRQARRRGIELT